MVLYLTRRSRFNQLTPIVIYVLYTLLSILIISSLIGKLTGKQFLGFRIFTIGEGVLLMYYLRRVLRSVKAKKLLFLLTIFFVLFALFDLITNIDADTFDSLPTVFECLIIIGFSTFYLYEQLGTPESLFLYSTPTFWIIVGLMLFFSGNFFVFIYAQSNSESPEFQTTFGLINTILSFIENILFLIAFIIARQQSKTIKSNIVAKTT